VRGSVVSGARRRAAAGGRVDVQALAAAQDRGALGDRGHRARCRASRRPAGARVRGVELERHTAEAHAGPPREWRAGAGVIGPLAQRREVDREDADPVPEVLAEAAGGDHVLEVAVGGRDQAHVDAARLLAADSLECAVLEDAQEAHLRGGGQLADLVEEERAAVGALAARVAMAPVKLPARGRTARSRPARSGSRRS
jgi:hypothetical protein